MNLSPIHISNVDTQGVAMPRLGLGTYLMTGDTCRAAVESALELGYRHIDTAEMYNNEAEIGQALESANVPRHQLHLTSKVWHDHLAPAQIKAALNTSLDKLKTDYLDLYMIHWPSPQMNLAAALETLQKLREDGLIRAIGVCNFTLSWLRLAVEELQTPIACNQIEYHLLLDQTPMRNYLASHSIPLTAYCPLAQGKLTDYPALVAIGEKHDATPAQIALAWLLDQENVCVIPKASRLASQRDNLQALAIKLDDEDRKAIAKLPKDQRRVNPDFAPAWD